MRNKINIKLIYKGGCLGCEHLHRMNAFSDIWYCDLEFKHNDNGKSWRENGKKMVKCNKYKKYEEKRCVDCKNTYYSDGDVGYWHCGADCHCFNYSAKACKFFSGSMDDYMKAKRRDEIKKRIEELEKQWVELERLKGEVVDKVGELKKELKDLGDDGNS